MSADLLDADALEDWEAWSESDDAEALNPPFVVHVYGMDDVLPARSWHEAAMVAHAHNVGFVALAAQRVMSVYGWATPYETTAARSIGVIR